MNVGLFQTQSKRMTYQDDSFNQDSLKLHAKKTDFLFLCYTEKSQKAL